jgi:hypothetical protein
MQYESEINIDLHKHSTGIDVPVFKIARKRKSQIVSFLMLFGLSLFSYNIKYTPFSISDFTLIVMVAVSILRARKISVSSVAVIGLLWLIVSFLGGLITNLLIFDSFPLFEFAKALMRATLGILFLFLGPPLINRIDISYFGSSLLTVLRIHALILIFQIFAWYFFAFQWGVFKNGVLRASGFFAEPAWFGWFVSLGLFGVISISLFCKSISLRWYDYLLFNLSSLLSTSLVAIILINTALFASCFMKKITTKELKKTLTFIVQFFAVVLLLVGVYFIVARLNLAYDPIQYLEKRVPAVLAGKDGSAQSRILGTLEVFSHVMKKSPLFGVGMGNEVSATKQILPILIFKGANTDLHIGFVAVFVSTGLIGGVIYLIMIGVLIGRRYTYLLGIGFLFVQLGFGGYRLGIFWFFLGLGIAINSNKACIVNTKKYNKKPSRDY